jgi:hypothetical protein
MQHARFAAHQPDVPRMPRAAASSVGWLTMITDCHFTDANDAIDLRGYRRAHCR